MQEKIDEAAKMWNKTKDPKYKELWYKLIKELSHGSGYYNLKGGTLPFDPNSREYND